MTDRDRWTIADVASHLGVAASTVRAWKARGKMPAPDASIDRRTPAWSAEVIMPWMRGHVDRRDAKRA